jgi:hypothetical protein
VPNSRRLQATVGPDGNGAIDLKALRGALGEEKFGQLTGFPGDPVEPPPPLITRPPPPVPFAERLPAFDGLDLPNHTGAPPEVYHLGDFVTPIPDANPDDWILKSIRGTDFLRGSNGWQGTAISDQQAKSKFLYADKIDQAWQSVLPQYAGTAASGTRLHSAAEKIIENLNIPDLFVEQSVLPNGVPKNVRLKGTIRLDVYHVQPNGTLVIYDFKAGNAVLKEKRIRQIVNQVGKRQNITNIVVLQVK